MNRLFTKRRPPDPSTYLVLAGWAAFLVSLAAAVVHTQFAYLYFRQPVESLLAPFTSWGTAAFLEWYRHAGRIVLVGLFFLSLPSLGNLLRRSIFPSVSPSPFVHAGLALIVWSTAGLFLASVGFCSAANLRIASIAITAVGFGAFWRFRRDHPAGLLGFPSDAVRSWVFWAVWIFALILLITTVVPDVFYDALVYHLAVPSAWLRSERLIDLPDIHHSRIPGLVQGLYLWGLAWGDDRFCKIMNWGFGVMTAWVLADWTSKQRDPETGRWAALLYLSSPMIGVNVWSCTNDILTGFLFFLAFIVWLEAWRPESCGRAGIFVLSGFFLGGATATKYTALFGAPFFALDLFLRLRRDPKSAARYGIFFAIGFLVPLLPWWIRTGVFTGNPFFPEGASLLGGDSPENIALLSSWKEEAAGSGHLFSRFLTLIRESFRGVEEGRFGFVGPLLLMLLPLGLFASVGGSLRPLIFCSGLSYVFFCFQTGRLRYFIPQIGLLFALSGIFLTDYFNSVRSNRLTHIARPLALLLRPDPGRWLKRLVGIMVVLNALYLVLVFGRFNQGWSVVLGGQSPQEYLRQEHIGVYGHPSQGSFDYLADQQASGKVFMIGEARSYRCPLPSRPAGSFNVPPYALWLNEDPSADGFVNRLRTEGYTYLLLNAPEWARLAPQPYKASEFVKPLGEALDMLAPPVFRDPWTVLFRVPQKRE